MQDEENSLLYRQLGIGWGEEIEKAFKQYRVNVNIKYSLYKSGRFIYEVKLKGTTREKHVRTRASDVQQKLRIPLFQVVTHDFIIYIIASMEKIVYCHLPKILSNREYKERSREMLLPYGVGYDIVGELVLVDLAQLPHLLVAGATKSGKTVGLQSLLLNIIYGKSPQQVNFILIDVGAADLILFNGISHLSCPVVSDRQMAYQVLILLMTEMERRIVLQMSNVEQFERLPRLVLVIDEFPALFMGMEDKQTVKLVVNVVSGLLQRGRHAKIHVVLAAQNPTIQNIKIDLGNITARIAFKCAKKNFSETIIGEGGAENLLGQGDMFFKYPQYDGVRWIQGAFISPEELQRMLSKIKGRWGYYHDDKFKFTINKADLQKKKTDIIDNSTVRSLERKADINNQMLIDILLWSLKQKSISCNLLMGEFNIGWKRASSFMEKLNALGIVEDLDSKLPRKVLIQSVGDLPQKIVDFLIENGVSSEEIAGAAGNND